MGIRSNERKGVKKKSKCARGRNEDLGRELGAEAFTEEDGILGHEKAETALHSIHQ